MLTWRWHVAPALALSLSVFEPLDLAITRSVSSDRGSYRSIQAPVDTAATAIPGLRLTASVHQDADNPRMLIGSVRLRNETSAPMQIVYGPCRMPHVIAAYRRRRDRRPIWINPYGQEACPTLGITFNLDPGSTQQINLRAVLERGPDGAALRVGCYYFTVRLDLRMPRLRSPELPAGRACVR
jgi:hypothetical protein